MKGFFHSPTVAKIFGYLGGAAVTLAQAGIKIGHVGQTDFVTLAGLIAMAIGIHGASNSSGSGK